MMRGNKFVIGLIVGIVLLIAIFFTGFMLLYFNVFKQS